MPQYETDMVIGGRIKELRDRKGWSQAALAREAGVSQAVIANLERGASHTTRFLAEIARALGCDPGEIDPKYANRPKHATPEDKLAARSSDEWDALIYASVDEAFRLADFPPQVAARIAAEIQTAIDTQLRVPPGMTAADVVRRVVRWELAELIRTARPK